MPDVILGWAVIATCLLILTLVTLANMHTRHRDVVEHLNRAAGTADELEFLRAFFERERAEYERLNRPWGAS